MAILDQLFSSRTRVKLLSTFLRNPDSEFYVRELTRLLDEQINSIRRELDNLKDVGLVRSRIKNRKKFFTVNQNFIIFPELKEIFEKTSAQNNELVQEMKKLGDLQLLVTSGFYTQAQSPIDLLIVGEFDRESLANYIKSLENTLNHSIMYTSMTADDYLFRKNARDAFLGQVFNCKHNILYNSLPNE